MKTSASLQIRKEQLLVLGTTTIGRIQQCIGRGNALQLVILEIPIVVKEIDLVKHQISVCYLRFCSAWIFNRLLYTQYSATLTELEAALIAMPIYAICIYIYKENTILIDLLAGTVIRIGAVMMLERCPLLACSAPGSGSV